MNVEDLLEEIIKSFKEYSEKLINLNTEKYINLIRYQKNRQSLFMV